VNLSPVTIGVAARPSRIFARPISPTVVYIVDGDAMVDAEQALVIRSRSGDRAAFEELVRATARGLFSRIYLQTADKHRTEDLVQETFLRAWRKLDSLSDPKIFRGWLAAIAHAVVLDAASAIRGKNEATQNRMSRRCSRLSLVTHPRPPRLSRPSSSSACCRS